MWVAEPAQQRRAPQVGELVELRDTGAEIAYPMDAKHHLGHRNPGTAEEVGTEREEGNPTLVGSPAPVADFRQVVDPT